MADLRFFVTQEGTLNQGGSGNDSIFNYTGTFSSDTVKGSGGNDLISFANQTTARRIVAVLPVPLQVAQQQSQLATPALGYLLVSSRKVLGYLPLL